jgi:hypothetical protein
MGSDQKATRDFALVQEIGSLAAKLANSLELSALTLRVTINQDTGRPHVEVVLTGDPSEEGPLAAFAHAMNLEAP